jgi:Putative porin
LKIKFLNKKTPILFSVFILFFSLEIIAQTGPIGGRYGSNDGSNRNGASSASDSIQQPVELDTATINYYFADAPKVIFSEHDSLLNNNFQQYDPARSGRLDYFHLGQTATAATPSVYQPFLRRGFDIGRHAFDIYTIRNADIRFYQQTKAFTDVSFSAAQQTDHVLHTRFGRNFANGVNLSIDYSRINNRTLSAPTQIKKKLFGGSGVAYDPARGLVSALGIGISVNRERYAGFFTFTANIISQLDKGGLDTTQDVTEANQFQLRNAFLTDATTRYEKYEYNYLQYFKLNRKDSTGEKRSYLASHQIIFRDSKYRSSDPFSTNSTTPRRQDSLFYGAFLTDSRGISFDLREKVLENAFSLSTTRQRKLTDSTKTKGQNDWFEVGLIHQFHNVNQGNGGKNLQNILLKGRWNFTPNDNMRLETYAHFNALGYNLGDYRLSGELFLNLKNIGNLTVKALNQLAAPTYLQDELVLTQKPFWSNNFKKTLETNLSGTIAIPRLKFEATAGYSLLNNYIYFDTKALAQQTATPLSILQLIVNQNFKLASFHLDNTIAFQKPTENIIRLPAIYTKNSLYWEGKLFKKVMLTRIGFDLRFVSKWNAPSYMPITGQFFQQDVKTVGEYPAVDAFLSFKVQRWRFFFKMENLVGGYANSPFYQTFNAPTPEAQFRFGLRLQLLN